METGCYIRMWYLWFVTALLWLIDWLIDCYFVLFIIAAALPEAQVATKLLECIRSKESLESMTKIIDSLPSVNPELSLYRNSINEYCLVF